MYSRPPVHFSACTKALSSSERDELGGVMTEGRLPVDTGMVMRDRESNQTELSQTGLFNHWLIYPTDVFSLPPLLFLPSPTQWRIAVMNIPLKSLFKWNPRPKRTPVFIHERSEWWWDRGHSHCLSLAGLCAFPSRLQWSTIYCWWKQIVHRVLQYRPRLASSKYSKTNPLLCNIFRMVIVL